MRSARVLVLPEPGPATIRRGPSGARIACSCSSLGSAMAARRLMATGEFPPAQQERGLADREDQADEALGVVQAGEQARGEHAGDEGAVGGPELAVVVAGEEFLGRPAGA